jgi:hypothetical protein
MTRRTRFQTDPVEVDHRASDLTRHGETQYWLVASTDDLRALLAGTVTAEVMTQAVTLLHRDVEDRSDHLPVTDK